MTQEIVRKSFDVSTLLEEREFIAYIATFDVDLVGDRIAPGAVRNLERFVRDGFVTVSHDWSAVPVASILEAWEDERGVLIRARFHSHPEAEAVYTYVRERTELGKSVRFSIGFYVLKTHDETAEDGRTVRVIDELELVEASIVNVPANPATELVAVKQNFVVPTEPEPQPEPAPAPEPEPEPASTPEPQPEPEHRQDYAELAGYYAKLMAECLEALFCKAEEEWAVGGARDLELVDDESWDADAAEAQVRRLCGGDPTSEDFDWNLYHKAFIVYNKAKPDAITSHKLPFAKVRDGKLVASRRGLIAAKVALSGGRGGVKLPADVIERALRFVESYLKEEEEQ
jgi:HK97 family phage prohead protease